MSDSRKIRPENYRVSYYPPNLNTSEKPFEPQDKTHERTYKPPLNIKNRKRKNRYRILPLLITGYLVFFITIALGTLFWSIPAFITKQDVASSTILPLLIFLLAIFLSAFLISLIIKARSFIPATVFTVTVLMAVSFISQGNISPSGMLQKSVYSLVCAYIAYLAVKLINRKK